MKRVFYLKINRCCSASLHIFWHWVQICTAFDADYFILVDCPKTREEIQKYYIKMNANLSANFINSYRDQLYDITYGLTSENLRNLGCAHLTPFLHAKENNINAFWSIDADDCLLCSPPDVCCKFLDCAEKIAITDYMNIFSLDMHYSAALPNSNGWSFGISFTNMNVDFMQKIIEGKRMLGNRKIWEVPNNVGWRNIDNFFSYLNEQGILVCKSWYVEGLVFEHCNEWINIFENNEIKYYYDRWMREKINIGDDVIKLKVELSENCSSLKIRREIMECSIDFMPVYQKQFWIFTGIKLDEIKEKNICFFGAGCVGISVMKIARIFNLKVQCFCDNNAELWGKTIDCVIVISPRQLLELDTENIAIIITTKKSNAEIKKQLTEIGIKPIN